MELELLLGFSIQEPKIFVCHRARSCPLLGIVDNAHTCTVVNVYGRRRLWVAELLEGKAHYFGSLCIEK